MCGVTGRIDFAGRDVIPYILVDLICLQNRGRDATGFVVGYTDKQVPYEPWKKLGSAGSLFGKESGEKAEELIERYQGDIGIGHVRYTTAGERTNKATQPHGFKHGGQSVVLASNGDIPFYDDVRRELTTRGCRFASRCDAEVLVNLVGLGIYHDRQDEVETFANVGRTLQAAYSLAAITPSGKLLGMRDPWGIRPLFWGQNKDGAMISSESAIMDGEFGTSIHEVEPGTIVVLTRDGEATVHRFAEAQRRFCLMEVYYFSRPDSTFRGITLDQVRYELGCEAAREWLERGYPKPDVVAPMPFSGGPAAEGCAATLGAHFRSVVKKDRFGGGRIFMYDQLSRAELAEISLSVVKEATEGRSVLLVDDSIIRADQIKVVCRKLQQAGAKSIYFISTAPPYRNPCFLGFNTPETGLLIAHGRTVEEVRLAVPGLNHLHYLTLKGTFKVMGGDQFCTGCYTGLSGYPVPVPDGGIEA